MIKEDQDLKLLKLVFPTIYGEGSKSNEIAKLLFEKTIDFLENDISFFTKHKERSQLLSRLTKALPSSNQGSVKIIWKCDYACSIVIRKPKKESPIDIKIIVPEEWTSGAHHWQAKNFEHCEPQGQSAFHLPLVAENHISLEQFFVNFSNALNDAINKIIADHQKDSETPIPKTPSMIEQACKLATHLAKFSTLYNGKITEADDDESDKDKVFTSEIQSLDLAKSEANTCWYVPEATIIDLITRNSSAQDWPGAEKLIVGFKGYILEKVTSDRVQKKKYDQMEVSNFKRCLDELIERYKKKVSIEENENINRYKDFKKFFGKIYEQLKKIANNGLTSRIDDVQEKQGSLKFEQPIPATINKPQNQHHQAQQIILAKINEFPLRVEKRLLLEELLDIGEGIEEQDFIQKDKWVLLAERTLFSLTEEFNTDKSIIDLYIHQREIQCEKDASNLCILVQKYEKLLTKDQEHEDHFGINMKGQTRSHIELVKTIASIVAFESAKMNRHKKKSNLKNYRIPINIDALYQGFVSHSYEARRAMKNVFKYHETRKNRNPLFKLDGTTNSFADFARLVAQQTRSAKVWIDNMKRILELKQQISFQNIKLDQSNQRISALVTQLSKPPNQYSNPFLGRIKHQEKTIQSSVKSVFAEYNQKDPWLFAFLQNIPPDVLGMMKIFYIAQNPKEKEQKPDKTNIFIPHFPDEKLPIRICSLEPYINSVWLDSGTVQIKNIPISSTFYDAKILFNGQSFAEELSSSLFEKYRKIFPVKQLIQYQGQLDFILHRPNDQNIKNREHRLYAKQILKPDELELEDFLATGNVRSANNTQLIVICLNILERKIISNSYNQGCLLAEETFLQTTGQLSLYHPQVEKQFSHIRKLITQFIKIWAFTDVTFCPSIGPFFGYISRALIDDQIPSEQQFEAIRRIIFEICMKCLEQYERGEAQLKGKPNEKIQWYQRFTLTSALMCLRQTILKPEDEQETIMLCNIIFSLRSTQIMSGRQEKPSEMRNFHEQLAFGISKTVYYNIETISNLLNSKPQYIGQIVKKMDPSYQQDVAWQRQNLFSFYGKSEINDDIYQIDLYLGKIFKNGKQISALDEQIKGSKQFISIFGKDRQFQVFQSHNAHFLRTKSNVNHQFKIDQSEGLIFFEFSEDGNQIRYIFRKKGGSTKDEEIWVLIKMQQLRKSNCFFPRLFLDHYQAWYSDKRKCIIFRKTSFEEIYHAGLVIHLNALVNSMKIDKAFYITYHGTFENQNLDDLCDKETKKYPQIILRSNQDKPEKVNCFKLLSKFEGPEYILELKNGERIQYYLHRYQSKFWLEEETRLSSESYFGYSLDYSFYQNESSIFNRFPCLVLQKHSKNQTLLNNQKRIVVISEGQVKYGGQIRKTRVAESHIGSYKYEIHDFFGDLRGASRQSLLHLSAIMLSINDNMKVTSIEMTPLDYAIYLLKSCLSNRPYGKKDVEKMEKIVRYLNPPESYVLLLECLWQCSSALTSILPFKEERFRSVFYELNDKELMTCKDLYEKKLSKETLRYRQKISEDLLNYIGMSLTEERIYGNEKTPGSPKESQESSSEESQPTVRIKKYWKNLKEFTGKKQEASFKGIKNRFEEFDEKVSQVFKIWKEQNPNKSAKKNIISKNIKKLAQNPECNPMSKEMIEQLESSYDIFLKQEVRIQLIMKKITGNKQSHVKKISQLIDSAYSLVNEIEELIESIKCKNEQHPDVISGMKPTLSFICFTKILCDPTNILEFFPFLNPIAQVGLVETIKMWMQLKTRISSFERMKVLFQASTLDAIALMREAQSPRSEVRKKNHWLCFQAQNKVQLWASQLDTYKNLTKSGDFCQLNMGQGKTQVIIPMMILDSIYEKKNYLPRINLLNSLIDEARGNFFRFLSVTSFQIPGFEIPFTREVQLWGFLYKDKNILTVQNLINSFSNRLYILMTRQSRLSEILRFSEVNRDHRSVSIQQSPLIPLNVKLYDIFDEIDELMNPLKSYIFSIGKTVDLSSSKERFEILRELIEVFLKNHLQALMKKNMAISEETFEQTLEFVKKGNYPPGLRLNIEHSKSEDLMKLKRMLAKDVILRLKSTYFSFFRTLTKQKKKYVIDYITNPLDISLKFPAYIEKTWRTQILVLRGALGFGIFEHCLSMRCGVNYGVPNKQHKKTIAVPYDAADIPSKTSEYQHPDVSIILSYFAYYTKGLTYEQFIQALKKLLTLSSTSKSIEYQFWLDCLSPESQDSISIKNVQQINFNSKVVVNEMYNYYRRNRRTIAFWLNACIFPSNLRQYNHSISASAWDLADVQNSVGFSGTKDNHWLYSDKLNWKPCKTPSISGTDGKMIHLITKHTNKICLIQQNDNNQWQRFVNQALQQKVDCIIDAGALCVGKSLERQIVPWISQHELFNREKFAGISFCDENGKWKVYDVEAKYYIARGTSIPDHETFVIFDEARTRGADLKMNSDVVAAISLGPQMTKDKFMQAAGRLRKLGRNQKLIIMATHEIFSSLPEFKKAKNIEKKIKNSTVQDLSNEILSWCCKNSIELNEKLMMQFASLGWDYIRSKEDKEIFIKGIKGKHDEQNPKNLSDLDRMYEHGMEKTTVSKLNQKIADSLGENYVNTSSGLHINKVLNTYGENVVKQAGTLDDVCERQVEPEPQRQIELQDAVIDLSPIEEVENPDEVTEIHGVSVSFDPKFKMTSNFTKTTQQYGSIDQRPKQLSELYFVLYDSTSIKAITLRQASKYIKSHIIDKKVPTKKIDLLYNLTIEDQFIKENQLQSALVSAKFLSGVENYNDIEQDYLITMLLRSIKLNTKWRENYENLTSSVLRKKRVYLKKFFGSTLEKIVTRVKNEDIEGYNPDASKAMNEEEEDMESSFESEEESNEDQMHEK